MDEIFNSLIGGTVPTVVMIIIYYLSIEKRLTRIETDITWLKKELPACRRPSVTDTE